MNLFSFIKQKLSILEVVSEYATLKKVGLYWKGCCPFHHEKTASFSVSPHKEIFYCFGCQAGGDVIAFIAKAENCSQLEAVYHLAEQYHISLPSKGLEKSKDHEEIKLYHTIHTLIAQWCHKQLLSNKDALNYLSKRQINTNSIKDFTLGYFPKGSSAIKQILTYAQHHNILAQDILATHVLLEGKSGLYSPFEDRIIFPIKDHIGRLCGFGGRIFRQHDERPKYYNSHDHAFFNKSSLLFGLDKAKKSIQEQEKVFLVEGYTDVIAMMQHGYTNTVATLGTACTQEHFKLLNRYAQKLYIVYDGDAAGKKAIIRLISLCWQANFDLFVITLPGQEDPASFLVKGNDLQPFIAQAQDIFLFYINHLGTNFNTKSLQERMKLTKQLLDIISQLEDSLKQDLLLQQAAHIFDIPFETLKHELKRTDKIALPTKNGKDNSTTKFEKQVFNTEESASLEPSTISKNKISQLEKKLFSAILSYRGMIASDDEELLNMWLSKDLKEVFTKVLTCKRHTPTANEAILFDIFNDDEKKMVSKLILEADEDGNMPSLEPLLIQFYKKQWKTLVHNVKIAIAYAQKKADHERVTYLLGKLDTLKKKMLQRGIS